MHPVIHLVQAGPLPPAEEKALDALYSVCRPYQAADPAVCLADHAADARAIVTRGDLGAGETLIAALPCLEIVAIYGVGYDAVDMAGCRARGIRVTNTPDVLTNDVADHALGMMLSLQRRIPDAERWVRSGAWAEKGPYPLTSRVHGRRAGILGLGRIGRAIARRLAAFDMPVSYCNRKPDPAADGLTFVEDAVTLAENCDILFVALPASPSTRRIVDASVLQALGRDGVLVNVSRAANIDEEALLVALETGALGGAALDVFENEPHIDPRFLALDTVLLQPHQGSATVETRLAMGQLMRDNLAAHFAGRALPSPVD